MSSVFHFVLAMQLAYSFSIELPPYIKPCALSDPNFEKCCLEHGKETLPFILKGDKKYKIPNLVPLHIPSVTVDAGENLKIYLKDLYAIGLDRVDLQQVKIDGKKQKITVKVNLDQLLLNGKYDVDGKILILPIKGSGDINITAVDGIYEYSCDYTLQKVGNEEHIVISDDDKLNFKLGRAIFHLTNLFNGDKALGDEMNKFLNENWSDVINEIGGAISQTIRSIIRAITTGIFDQISYNELFLP